MRILVIAIAALLLMIIIFLFVVRVQFEIRLIARKSRAHISFVSAIGIGRFNYAISRSAQRFWFQLRLPERFSPYLDYILDYLIPSPFMRVIVQLLIIALLTDKDEHSPKRRQISIEQIKKLARHRFWRRIRLTEAGIYARIGTGNAAQTAITTGQWWAIIGSIASVAKARLGGQHKLRAHIIPEFNRTIQSIRAHCILATSPADIIVVALHLRNWKEAKHERPSDSRTNEDGHGKHSGNG